MRKFASVIEGVALAGCAAMVLIFPRQTAEGIQLGTELCLERIIPSIFPMMLVSIMVVESGYAVRLGRYLAPLSRRLFGLPGEAGTALLLSVIGGYPAGAKAVTGLYEKGAVTREQAAKMAQFCFCAGPAFLVGVVGGLTGSPALGWLLMAVQLVAVTVTGMLVCARRACGQCMSGHGERTPLRGLSDTIVISVNKAAGAMLQVCLYVVVFSAVRAIMERIGAAGLIVSLFTAFGVGEQAAQAVMPVLLEVTGGCVSAVNAGLPMVAFAVGFGGLSVQMQVLSITRYLGVSQGRFFLMRLVQGTLSALLTALALRLLPEGAAIEASAGFADAGLSGSPQGAVMLIVMCAMCVLCLPGDDIGSRAWKKEGRR